MARQTATKSSNDDTWYLSTQKCIPKKGGGVERNMYKLRYSVAYKNNVLQKTNSLSHSWYRNGLLLLNYLFKFRKMVAYQNVTPVRLVKNGFSLNFEKQISLYFNWGQKIQIFQSKHLY